MRDMEAATMLVNEVICRFGVIDSDGLVERCTLLDMLSIAVMDEESSWNLQIPRLIRLAFMTLLVPHHLS